ncbi:peroxiredoxin [Kaistella anthropi]|nr:peroxiredoxin [Kaistella anthropi]
MLKVGDQLPEFVSVNQDGESVNSQDLLGKNWSFSFIQKPIHLYCTAEACDLNDHFSKLKKEGFQLLGVSADPVKNQKKFHEKFGFQYPLLADENRDVIEKFGVWQLKKFMGKEFMGIVRTTFIFDENGICTRVIDKVKTKEAAKQILEN